LFGREAVSFTKPKLAASLSVVIAAFLYLFVSQCVRWWEVRQNLRISKLKWWRYLDPVVLSSGPNGEGSISRLQILFFSFLVLALLLFIFAKVGQLSGLSDTILLLMGISGISAGMAKAAEVGRERLSLENWAWLIDRQWMRQNGLAATKVASWSAIVTSTDGVDVYHVQMLVFSLVVGMSLLSSGVTSTDLSSFEIPQSMLLLLGLSQAVYIGGKLVATPIVQDLDKALNKLHELETAFREAALKDAAPPKTLDEAIKRAEKEYFNFTEQRKIVQTIFKTVIGDLPPKTVPGEKPLNPEFEPRFPKSASTE
jgi:hypothetical protein